MDENPNLKVRAKGDSLWARLTQARRDRTLPKAPLGLQRAAAAQAHTAFQMLEQHWKDWAGKAGQEQDEKVSGRLLRGLLKKPRPITSYLRSHPSKQHRRQAICVLEGVTLMEDGRTVKIRGVGTIVLEETVHEPIRSAQLVEHKGELWLHAQHGEKLPESKPLDGKTVGYDSGIVHTLTSSDGEHLHRPDTTELQRKAQNIYRHRAKCCTYKSRQWRRLGNKAKNILAKVAYIQENWERHTAKDISEGHCVVGVENLQLKSMTASAKGTSSVPGSRRKAKLNEGLARARIGGLHHAVHRRAVRDGTWVVAVNPQNTSIQCSSCGHKDKESRQAEKFECTQCGFATHADENAGRNVRTRAENVLTGYRRMEGGRDGCPGGLAPNRQGSQEGHGEAGNSTLHPREAPAAREVSGPRDRLGWTGSDAVKSSI